ncbi:MAG: polymer-forming cytoskeletal protein [Alphaproteobacteria bacterium]|nr:polymer-forming cytoskeletal protein [Alphaproteobacteria bacterium]
MSLFTKKSAEPKPNQPARATYIAAGSIITGDLASDGELQMDGVLRGNVSCRRLVVGQNGELHGEVTADTLIVDGAIFGAVKAKTVLLGASARMIGDVDHEVLEVRPGAEIEGRYSQSSFAGRKDMRGKSKPGLKFSAMQKQAPPSAPGKPPAKTPLPGQNGADADSDAATTQIEASSAPDRPSTH